MYKIKNDYITELAAKRRAVEDAVAYFDKNRKEYLIRLEVSYYEAKDIVEKKREEIIARREIISQYLGYECVQYWLAGERGTLALHKDNYLELWEMLKENQPTKEELPKKSLHGFLNRIFQSKNKK